MCPTPGEKRDLDDLIAESRRIQDALIRVVVKLDIFAEQLSGEAAKLQGVVDDERVPEGEAAPDDGPGRAPGTTDSGTKGDGGGEQ